MQQVLVLMFTAEPAEAAASTSATARSPSAWTPLRPLHAADEIEGLRPSARRIIDARYPHWVNFVRSQLEAQYDAQTIYRSGFIVYTTLDPALQDAAQQTGHRAGGRSWRTRTPRTARWLPSSPSTGEILAMVGSPDFNNDAISGQVNMATSPTRQPGSSIKPFTYVAAFEKGWTPPR
ncbi:MAG: penicillin-binding transpeptidase domain-containing protein [Candidatus Moduliflexus flocculans]|nr:penicillin-binding transpeptidase domain-containing protein [Candidatus Moduliflexus flocculans]